MPRIGDGTGLGSMPPSHEGLSHVDGDESNSSGVQQTGHPMHAGPHRVTHPHGDKGASKTD